MAGNSAVLFRGGPLKQLKHGARKTGGRNNHGRITAFHRGGGAKRSLRDIDMKRTIPDLTGTVERIEYDPFRTGRTALIRWDGEQTPSSPTDGGGSGEGKSTQFKIKDMQRGALPRGIHDMPRRALRATIATICGVPLQLRKTREPVTVTIDGRKKFSSLAREADRGLQDLTGDEELKVRL